MSNGVDWTLMDPASGPPFPRSLGVYWPWYKPLIEGVEPEEMLYAPPTPTYYPPAYQAPVYYAPVAAPVITTVEIIRPPTEIPTKRYVPPKAVPEVIALPDLRFEDLRIQPSTVTVGEPVEVSVLGRNLGDALGSERVTFEVDGLVESKDVNLRPLESKFISYSFIPKKAGDYNILVNGLKGRLQVLELPKPPEVPAVPKLPVEVPTKEYHLYVDTSGEGKVVPESGDYLAGLPIVLTALPAPGYSFSRWGGDVSGTAPVAEVVMDRDKSVTAYFETAEVPVVPKPKVPTISHFADLRIIGYDSSLAVGDICPVEVSFEYEGPRTSRKLYAAIGSVVAGVFDEYMHGSKGVTVPSTASWETYRGTVDIQVPRIRPGTYDLYAKLDGMGADSIHHNVITIEGEPVLPPVEIEISPPEVVTPKPTPSPVGKSEFTTVRCIPMITSVRRGDPFTILVHYTHIGASQDVRVYAAIGEEVAIGGIKHFDEKASMWRTITVPNDTRRVERVEALDVPTTGLSPGTYSIYAKLKHPWWGEVVSPTVSNVAKILPSR